MAFNDCDPHCVQPSIRPNLTTCNPDYVQPSREGANPNGFHVMEFNDYSMVLSDPQLDLLSSLLKVKNANRDEVTETFKGLLPKRFAQFGSDLLRGPMAEYEALKTHACAWNMLLKRRYVWVKTRPLGLYESWLTTAC